MVTPAMAPRSTRSLSPQPPADFLARIKTSSEKLPNRVVLHGVEGVGKTSFAAHAPNPIFLMARGETGLDTLIGAGQLGEIPHFPELKTWAETIGALDSLLRGEHEYRTVVLDALNGFERLCHEQVCEVSFGNDWTDRGFASYGKGPEVAMSEWRQFLGMLDRLREERKMSVLLLAHTKVKTFKNPEGPDYDRYTVDLNDKTWSATHKWADMVLFATFYVEAVKEKGTERAKGKGGQERIVHTERHASFDAKNRNGLPPEFSFGRSGAEAWSNFVDALKSGRAAASNGGAA